MFMKRVKFPVSAKVACYNTSSFEGGLLSQSTKSGQYLLKGGVSSTDPIPDKIYGIFIDEHLFIPLPKFDRTFKPAKDVAKPFPTIDEMVPNLYQLLRLKTVLTKVNNALCKIGRQDCKISADVLKSVWYKEALAKAEPSELRRFVPICAYNCESIPAVQYRLYDKNTLLICDNTSAYHIVLGTPEALSPILQFSWNSFDFLSAPVIYSKSYDFYRGADKSLMFIGKDVLVQPLDDELIIIDTHLYQDINGTLCYITEFGKDAHFQYEPERAGFFIAEPKQRYENGKLKESWTENERFAKNEEGLFVCIGSDKSSYAPHSGFDLGF